MIADCLAFTAKLISGCQAEWVDCAPLPVPRIYFGNHGSHLDALVIWSSLPPEVRANCRLVAARDYWEKNFVRRAIAQDVFNAVLIERKHVTKSNNPLTLMLEALAQGYSLVIFPEGGRGGDNGIGEFQAGLHHLAVKCPQAELVPVYLENLNRILPKGKFIPIPLIGHITFGAPLRVQEGEKRDEFLQRARGAIEKLKERV